MAKTPQHDREGRQAEVGLRLAAAGWEEEQVHELAVRLFRVGERGEVEQDEGELEGAPLRPAFREHVRVSPPERLGDGSVGHAEGVEGLFVSLQRGDSLLHSVGGELRAPQEFLGSAGVFAVDARKFRPAALDPLAVGGYQRLERRLRFGATGQCPEPLHREIDAGRLEGLGLLDLGTRDPGRPHRAATTIFLLVPLGRYVVAGGVAGRIRVVQGRHLFVPVVVLGRAKIGPARKGPVAMHFEFRLEGVRRFLFVEGAGRLPIVHQEHGDRQGPGGNRLEFRNRPALDMELEAARVRDIVNGGAFAAAQVDRDDFLPWCPLPEAAASAGIVFLFGPLVVAPAHGDPERRVRRKKAQPHRRRKEGLLRCLAVFTRFLCEARAFGNLVEVVVVFVIPACAELRRRAGGDQEPSEVPVRGRFVGGQPLPGEFVIGTGADEVDLEGVDEGLAYCERGCRRRMGDVGSRHAAMPRANRGAATSRRTRTCRRMVPFARREGRRRP